MTARPAPVRPGGAVAGRAASVAPDRNADGSAEGDVDLPELLKEVRRIDVLSRRLVTDVMSGGYTSAFRGAGIEFEEVREYVVGDDPRSVDWSVTARMGRPYVRKYVEEREQTVLFLLDLSASMTGGFGAWSARQTAARICACLALTAIRNDDKVGLVAFGETVDRWVPPAEGAGHVLRVVRDCLALPAVSARTDLGPALEFAARAVRRRAIVFVVSDFLAGGWQRAIRAASRRHDVVAVRLLPPEIDAPGDGMMRLRDAETGREALVDWGDARVRAEYARRVAAWRTRTADEITRAGADRMDVPVPRRADRHAIAGPILRFFRMREMRGTKR